MNTPKHLSTYPLAYYDSQLLFFEILKQKLYPVYRYKQGNCHNLVHFASLQLHRMKMPHKKIWIFAPSRYDNQSKNSITLPDPNYISASGQLKWGYHVAILLLRPDQNMVIDYFLDENSPLTIDEWLARFKIKDYVLDITTSEKYLFYGQPSQGYKQQLFSGKYFEHEGQCKQENWVAKGLAINETAIKFYENNFFQFIVKSSYSKYYKNILGNTFTLEKALTLQKYPAKIGKHVINELNKVLEPYRIYYKTSLDNWVQKMNILTQSEIMSY
jgi:hypothetical protein